MGMLINAGKESLNPINIFKWIKYKIKFVKEHPYYFNPDGLLIFCGGQGTGKTLSAVNYVYRLMQIYPKAKLVTNLKLKDFDIITYDNYIENHYELIKKYVENGYSEEFIKEIMYENYLQDNKVFQFVNNDDFQKYNNGEYGVIFLVDEIQLYLNSLESKNINMETVTQISQQRKQRKHIVCTSQVFGRMAKPLREQFSNVISCKNYLGFLQFNRLIDRDSLESDNSTDTNITGKVKKRFIWLHSPYMYKRYDTYYVIERGKFVAGEEKKEGVYDGIGLSGSN